VRLAAIEVVDSSRRARVVALVRVGDSQQSIQEILVEQGQARVAK
jgi:endonuclease YncB( thermonuclease family)